MRYISHLDLMRCFSRAIVRAKIPLWYTEGFNPRPYMNFALPLSLGIDSICEAVDIRTMDDITPEETMERLNKVLPSGIEIYKTEDTEIKASQIEKADYSVSFGTDEKSAENFIYSSKAIVEGNDFYIEKTGKKGKNKIVKQISLTGVIQNYEIDYSDGKILITMRLPAGNTFNVNPKSVLDKLLLMTDTKSECPEIIRKNLIIKDGAIF